MPRCFILTLTALVSLTHASSAADWPTFRQNAQRRAVASENINPAKLANTWTYQSDAPPQTAWAKPAKWDAYARLPGLRSMRNYDASPGLAIANEKTYIASSSNDSITCLNLTNGKTLWQFFASGPVRISPTVADNRVYFGSDDGHAYCINAATGKLIWKFKPAVSSPLIIHNGRLISKWPCRTGVTVIKNIAYCAFSLLPWEKSYLCALDAKTGKPTSPGCFIRELNNATIEGPMATSNKHLIAAQGRIPPRLFNLTNGSDAGTLKGGGGSFIMVDETQSVHHGPGNKTGWVTVSNSTTCKPIATHKGYNAGLIGATLEYRLSDHRVTAFNRNTKALAWKTEFPNAQDLILNQNTLYVGGRDEIIALNALTGKRVWSSPVRGDATLLAAASNSLFVSTDTGAIHCFRQSSSPSVNPTPTPKPTPRRPSQDILKKTPLVKTKDMIGYWAFHSGMTARARRRGLPNPERRALDLAGSSHATIQGDINIRQIGGIEALLLDGRTNTITLQKDHKKANLPKKHITAEAWIRIDKAQPWGGIIGAIQDNGNYERGWLLGFQGNKFCFALNANSGPDKLTYLTAKSSFKTETWYHVVGTYDGKTQRIYVNGKLENTSTQQSGDIKYPPTAFYEIGAYHDNDENFKTLGMIHEVRLYKSALTSTRVLANHKSKIKNLPKPIHLPTGPYARFINPTTARIIWHTHTPKPSILTLTNAGQTRKIIDKQPKTEHRLTINDLKANRVYKYQIATGPSAFTPAFELDTSFNFTLPDIPSRPYPFTEDALAKTTRKKAQLFLTESGLDKGICLVLGASDGRLVYELAKRSNLIVIGLDTNPASVATARAALAKAGLYGKRASIHHVQSFAQVPFTGDFANLIITDQIPNPVKPAIPASEIHRLLRPDGGLALINWPTPASSKPISSDAIRQWTGPVKHTTTKTSQGLLTQFTRAPLKGAGEWSHLYGKPNNAAFGGESLGGVSGAKDLQIQWLGRPGPRAQADRNGRKPSPLSTSGRLFIQGLHRLIALDAYNGTVLWSLEIPPMQRFNMPRDSSNWCADSQHVFVAVNNASWKINAQTGNVESITPVTPAKNKDWQYDWSYIARHDQVLLGSAVKKGTAFVEFWGGADAGWYDARKGPVTFKVCSDNLFAKHNSTGKNLWTYSRGVILNSTITVANNKIFFVESRHPKVLASQSRRIGTPELWTDLHLVALDIKTGKPAWQKPLKTANGIVTYYMSHGKDSLVIASSGAKKYDVYAYADTSGKQLWHSTFSWLGGKGDHGKAMSRPAIAGDRLFVRPLVLNLKTGKTIGQMPSGGCGTYALTADAVIFRSGNVTMWDAAQNKKTAFPRLRPGCWLSTIPAAGMLLSPEAGGGCSCGVWLETSIAFKPILKK